MPDGVSRDVAAPGLWESLLNEVHTESRVPDKKVLVLGRPGIGKRTLVHQMLVHAAPNVKTDDQAEMAPEGHSRVLGLDYLYFGARDPNEDDAATAPDFVCPATCKTMIFEDQAFEGILTSRLTTQDLHGLAAVICLDLKQPWLMMEDLQAWFAFVSRIISNLMKEVPMAEQDEIRGKVFATLSGYCAPGEGAEDGASRGGSQNDMVCNIGIPVVVVVTRSDGASALEAQNTIGWSEIIEAYLRNECVSYGAALVYAMVQPKKNRNVDVLYSYLMHRLYGYPLKFAATTPSRDALFIPSGWDSLLKVGEFAAQLAHGKGLEPAFESLITHAEPAAQEKVPPVECESMQEFLQRCRKQGGGTSMARAQRRSEASSGTLADLVESREAGASAFRTLARTPTLDIESTRATLAGLAASTATRPDLVRAATALPAVSANPAEPLARSLRFEPQLERGTTAPAALPLGRSSSASAGVSNLLAEALDDDLASLAATPTARGPAEGLSKTPTKTADESLGVAEPPEAEDKLSEAAVTAER